MKTTKHTISVPSPGKVDPPVEEDILWVRKTLELDPAGGEFRVAYGSIAKDDKEIAILIRSILEIIIDLASSIEVPALHVEEKRVNPTMPEETVQGIPVPALNRIHSTTDKPGDAFIAVPYRNYGSGSMTATCGRRHSFRF